MGWTPGYLQRYRAERSQRAAAVLGSMTTILTRYEADVGAVSSVDLSESRTQPVAT